MQENVGDFGIPYDFDSPETYVPPIEFRQKELIVDQSDNLGSQNRRHVSFKRRLVKGFALGAIINFLPSAQIVDYSAEHNSDGGCIESDTDLLLTQYELDAAIDNHEDQSALSEDEKNYLIDLVGDTNNLDEVEDVLSNVFSRWGIKAYVGKLPDDMEDIYQDLSDLKQKDVINSSIDLIHSLSKTPDSLMKLGQGMNVYFGHNFYNSKGSLGGLRTAVNMYGEPKEMVLIDIGLPDDTADIFMHEFSHTIHGRMCVTPEQDTEFTDSNTEPYTKKFQGNEEVQLYGYKTPYGAVNVAEDFATNAQEILLSGAQYCYDTQQRPIDEVICAKEEIFLGRLNTINPEIPIYYIARAENAYRDVKESNPLFEYQSSPYLIEDDK
jgi:hypothetical protein